MADQVQTGAPAGPSATYDRMPQHAAAQLQQKGLNPDEYAMDPTGRFAVHHSIASQYGVGFSPAGSGAGAGQWQSRTIGGFGMATQEVPHWTPAAMGSRGQSSGSLPLTTPYNPMQEPDHPHHQWYMNKLNEGDQRVREATEKADQNARYLKAFNDSKAAPPGRAASASGLSPAAPAAAPASAPAPAPAAKRPATADPNQLAPWAMDHVRKTGNDPSKFMMSPTGGLMTRPAVPAPGASLSTSATEVGSAAGQALGGAGMSRPGVAPFPDKNAWLAKGYSPDQIATFDPNKVNRAYNVAANRYNGYGHEQDPVRRALLRDIYDARLDSRARGESVFGGGGVHPTLQALLAYDHQKALGDQVAQNDPDRQIGRMRDIANDPVLRTYYPASKGIDPSSIPALPMPGSPGGPGAPQVNAQNLGQHLGAQSNATLSGILGGEGDLLAKLRQTATLPGFGDPGHPNTQMIRQWALGQQAADPHQWVENTFLPPNPDATPLSGFGPLNRFAGLSKAFFDSSLFNSGHSAGTGLDWRKNYKERIELGDLLRQIQMAQEVH